MPMVSCPACAAKLKVPDHLAGKKIRCPKCQDVISVPAESAESAVAAGPAPRKAATGAAAKPSGVRAGAKSGPPPLNGVRPTDKSAPPPRKRPVRDEEEDDDDRDEDEEDEDEAPKKSKSGKKRKQKGLPIALLAGVGGVLVLALLVGGYFIFFAGSGDTKTAGNLPGGGKPGGNIPGGNNPPGVNPEVVLGPDAKFLPDSTEMIVTCRVAEAMGSSVLAKLRQEIPMLEEAMKEMEDFKNYTGIAVEDIESVMLGGKFVNKDREVIAVLHVTKDVPMSKVLQGIAVGGKATEEKVGDLTIHTSPSGINSVCLVNPKQILFSLSPNVLKTALQRGTAPALSSELQTALGEVKMSSTLAVVMSTRSLMPETSKPPQPFPGGPPGGIPQPPGGPPGGQPFPGGPPGGPPGGQPFPGGPPGGPPGGQPFPGGPPGGQPFPGGPPGGGTSSPIPDAAALEVNLGTSIELKAIAFFKDEQSCKDIENKITQAMAKIKTEKDYQQFQGLLGSLKIEAQGPRLIAQTSMDPGVLANTVKGVMSGPLPNLPPDILKLIGGAGGPVQPPRKQ